MSDLPFDADTIVNAIFERIEERLQPQIQPRFLTVRQAAEYVGVSEDSIRSILLSGRIATLRPVKGRIVVDRLELENFVRSTSKTTMRRGRGIRKK